MNKRIQRKRTNKQTNLVTDYGFPNNIPKTLKIGSTSSPYKPLGHKENCKCSQCKLRREWELNKELKIVGIKNDRINNR